MINHDDVFKEVEITRGFRPGEIDGKPFLIGWFRVITRDGRTGDIISDVTRDTGFIISHLGGPAEK